MKRVAVIAIFLAVMASLFAFPGYATTYNPTTYNSYTDAVTINGVTYNVRVTQLKALSEGTSLLPGGMETIMLVSLQMTNNTNSVKAATIPKLTIDLSDERVITDVFTYGGDFTLGLLSGGISIFYPGSEFSLDNNKVVVPPNKSLYCVGAIGLPAQLSQDGSSTLDTGLRAVHLYDKANYSVTDGNYSYGNPVDLSPVITYIDGIETALTTSNNNTNTIINRLNNIITLLTYVGSDYTPYTDNISFYDSGIVSNSYVSTLGTRLYRIISPSYYINNDIEIDAANDEIVNTGTLVKFIHIKLDISNNGTQPIKLGEQLAINNVLPSGTLAYEIVNVDTQDFNAFEFQNVNSGQAGRRLYFRFLYPIEKNGYIMPNHRAQVSLTIKVYFYETDTLTFYDPAFYSPTNPTIVDDIYAPRNIMELLRDWYLSYKNVNGLDDIDDAAEDITDKSETAHTQEQSYFTQNARAIEQTGLSNYRFNGDQENGIGSVSHDFTLLWNALGGFNSVYIFSLTLSLALMVLRHAPGVIKSSRRNKEE